MAALYFDGDKRRIYEVPVNSSFTTDIDGYRVYIPDDIPSASKEVFFTSIQLWSGFVNYHNLNKWTTNCFAKTGGAFRFQDQNGIDVYATFDIRYTNEWLFVPSDYKHNLTVLGNVFKELSLDADFDTDRIVSQGVSPRVQLADSNQTLKIPTGSGLSIEQETTLNTIKTVVDAIKVVADGIKAVTDWLFRWATAKEVIAPNNYQRRDADTDEVLMDMDVSKSNGVTTISKKE